MKNILNQKPRAELNNRLLYSCNFVNDNDIKDKEVLDIGCGYGWFELNAITRGVNKIIATELTEKDLVTINNNVKDEKVYTMVASAIKLPFDDNTFDTVVSWEVIEHIPKKTEEEMFSEIYRVLKPGGVLYLSTPFKSFLSNTLDPAWWLIGHRHYSKKQLQAFAGKNGFNDGQFFIEGKIWTLIASLNMYISKWIFRRDLLFGNFFIKKESTEYGNSNGFATIFAKFIKK